MRLRTRDETSDPIILKGRDVHSSGKTLATFTKVVRGTLGSSSIEDYTSRATSRGRPDQPMRLRRSMISSTPGFLSLRITANSTKSWRTISDMFAINPDFGSYPISGLPAKYVGDYASLPDWDSSSQSYDPTAFKRMRPDKAVTELAVSLIEIRDLKKSIVSVRDAWRSISELLRGGRFARKTVKDVLGSHLGVEFGLLPLIDDTRKCITSFDKFNQFVNRYATTTGSPVIKRSWASILDERGSDSVPTTISVSSSGLFTSLGPSVVNTYKSNDIYVTRTWGDNVWAQAEWKVYLKRPTTRLEFANLYRRFLGLRLGVDTIWELIPFSFMADYVSTVGDSLANLSPGVADEVVITKGVSMRHRYLHATAVYTTYMTGGTFYTLNRERASCSASASLVYESKTRKLLDPYGIYIKPPDLNFRQIATLSSLGLLTALKTTK